MFKLASIQKQNVFAYSVFSLMLVLFSLVATPTHAAESRMECRNTNVAGDAEFGVTDFLLTATLSGELDGEWELKDFRSSFEIHRWMPGDHFPSGDLWHFDVAEAASVTFDANYESNFYPDHLRFAMPFGQDRLLEYEDETEQDQRPPRYFFVFPELEELHHDEVVDAVAMLYGIKGSFGATVYIACHIR